METKTNLVLAGHERFTLASPLPVKKRSFQLQTQWKKSLTIPPMTAWMFLDRSE